jgi:hypothetical protein
MPGRSFAKFNLTTVAIITASRREAHVGKQGTLVKNRTIDGRGISPLAHFAVKLPTLFSLFSFL